MINKRIIDRRQITRRVERKKKIHDISYIGILTSKVFFPEDTKKTKSYFDLIEELKKRW